MSRRTISSGTVARGTDASWDHVLVRGRGMIDGAPASHKILPFRLREASKTSCLPERREIEISAVPGTVIATRGRPHLRNSLTVHTAVGRTGNVVPPSLASRHEKAALGLPRCEGRWRLRLGSSRPRLRREAGWLDDLRRRLLLSGRGMVRCSTRCAGCGPAQQPARAQPSSAARRRPGRFMNPLRRFSAPHTKPGRLWLDASPSLATVPHEPRPPRWR